MNLETLEQKLAEKLAEKDAMISNHNRALGQIDWEIKTKKDEAERAHSIYRWNNLTPGSKDNGNVRPLRLRGKVLD